MHLDREVSTWGATRKSLKGAGAVCLAVLAVAQAGAQGPIELSNVVAGTNGFAIDGVAISNRTGNSVSGGGDVNGDGIGDLIVSEITSVFFPATSKVFTRLSGCN